MSTRGAIARATDTKQGTWVGRYNHWDSYPTALGKTLWDLYHGHFARDLDAMLAYLIDQHPAGWSTINHCDFTQPAGFLSYDDDRRVHGPICYCHGARSEEAQTLTDQNAAECGAEYAYVFDVPARVLHVLSSYNPTGGKMIGMFGSGNPNAEWRELAAVDLDGPEPDWAKMKS